MRLIKKIQNLFQSKPDPRTLEAIILFNQQHFRDALLKFEEPWKETCGQEERFLRALIQVAGAFHHFQENRLESALSLYISSLDLLSHYRPKYQRINIEGLMIDLNSAFAELVQQGVKSNVKLNEKLIPMIKIIR